MVNKGEAKYILIEALYFHSMYSLPTLFKNNLLDLFIFYVFRFIVVWFILILFICV